MNTMATKESYKRVLDILFLSDDPEPAKTFLTMTFTVYAEFWAGVTGNH